MRGRVERIWPPRVLGLTWRGLVACWPVVLAVWVAVAAISIGALHLRRPVDDSLAVFGWYLARTVGRTALLSLVSTVLVVWLIQRLEPAALGGDTPARRLAWGWAGALVSGLVILSPSLAAMGVLMTTSDVRFNGTVYLVVGVLGLLLGVYLGYAQGEAITRRIGPGRALLASIRITRGNRIFLLVVTILVGVAHQAVTLAMQTPPGLSDLARLQATAGLQALVSTLATVLGTGIYLELRRVHRAGQPDGISEAFD